MSDTGERTAVELLMLAAWCGVSVDKLPPENTAHANEYTMAAWRRVAMAALDFYAAGGHAAPIEALRKENKRLKEALRPLAAVVIPAEADDDAAAAFSLNGLGDPGGVEITVVDVRRARAALQGETG